MESIVEKRRSQRVDFKVKAKSISKNKGYQGSIENFSREGMLKSIPNGHVLDIIPGTTVGVSFQIPSGETLNLECEVKWIRHLPDMPYGIKHHVGMEVQNPPQKYTEFVEGLYNESFYNSLVQKIDYKDL
jgi:hypothetical protein